MSGPTISCSSSSDHPTATTGGRVIGWIRAGRYGSEPQPRTSLRSLTIYRSITRQRVTEVDALDLDPGAERVPGSQELRQVPADPQANSKADGSAGHRDGALSASSSGPNSKDSTSSAAWVSGISARSATRARIASAICADWAGARARTVSGSATLRTTSRAASASLPVWCARSS
jgi:hypothetical protein